MRYLFKIFKREKKSCRMPFPSFVDNWKEDEYQKNIQEGVLSLQRNQKILIYDDGRGYELALDIKKQFILNYQKQLAEKIKITGTNNICVYFEE